ncbi:polymer-forming cytoskeletal protein [Pseudoalteromonas sp. JBTF-M23]|uniref:Polymer-forming cytoskeletal protein n=1 Tax=Pseudoalteromonas caenipelagi TaxID=2726988 RepID=A0A849VKJ6_9GAMM|nr:polymer-forming cytoskeletal protein [Pseudoalteromonas caenipelagi]NOU53168.1 polymer-forming cytoskeletal protein [Pseudoalteromonas caenipelagi]
MKKHRGFTLVKVLLLSTMAGVVVFGAMKETLVQERLSGNFQKSMNARFLSEKGIYIVAQRLRNELIQSPLLTRDELISTQGVYTGGGELGDDLKYDVTVSAHPTDESLVVITSSGERYSGDSNDKIIAYYKFTKGTVSPVHDSLLAGCTGVYLQGSGLIDSYDSSVGSYEQTKAGNAIINTSSTNGDVTIKGHSIIKGDVNAAGSVYMLGSSPIYGDVMANGNVEISPGGGIRVDGNVLTVGNIEHLGGEITGYVRANGNATMKWGASIANLNNDDFDIQYGGTGTFPDGSDFYQDGVHYSSSRFNVDPQIAAIDAPGVGSAECDPLAIVDNMAQVIGNSSSYPYYTVGANDYYTFTPQRLIYERRNGNSGNSNGDPTIIWASESDVYVFDNITQRYDDLGSSTSGNEYVYTMKGFDVGSNGNVIIQGGDVIFLVDGDFSIKGGSSMTIKAGSSLSIFVTGNVELGGSGNVFVEQHGIATSGHAAFNIYSAKAGESVSLSGNSDMYAVVYAPLATIGIQGNGSIFGSVIGSFISGIGNADYHFDEALKTLDLGVGSGGSGSTLTPPSLVFDRWYYRLPERVKEEN